MIDIVFLYYYVRHYLDTPFERLLWILPNRVYHLCFYQRTRPSPLILDLYIFQIRGHWFSWSLHNWLFLILKSRILDTISQALIHLQLCWIFRTNNYPENPKILRNSSKSIALDPSWSRSWIMLTISSALYSIPKAMIAFFISLGLLLKNIVTKFHHSYHHQRYQSIP